MLKYIFFWTTCILFVSVNRSIAQDTEAPTKLSSVPSEGNSGISVKLSESSIAFSESIVEPSTGYDSLVSILPAVANYTVSYNAPSKELRISFNDYLTYETLYTVSVKGAKDAAGNVAETLSFSFTTGKAVEVNNMLTSNICIGDPVGADLSDIVITENLADNFFSSSDDQEHRLVLEVDEGFEFISPGTITLETPNDITNESVSIGGNPRNLIISYKLCSNTDCAPAAIQSDKITLSGIEVRTTDANTPVSGTTYDIKRIGAANNDAVMPGLPPSTDGNPTVFARLQVAESPSIELTNLGTSQAIIDAIVLCPNGDDFAINAEIEDPSNAVTYYISRTQVSADFVQLGLDTLQVLNESLISTLLFAGEEVVYPVFLQATVNGALCDGFSPLITITKDDGTSTPNASFSTSFPAENTTVTPGVSQDEFIVAVDNPGGILNIYETVGTAQETLLHTDPEYNNEQFILGITENASLTERVTIRLNYALLLDGTTCVGSQEDYIFNISPIPNSEEDIGVSPTFCATSINGTVPITFVPEDFDTELEYENLVISGPGITGSANWNPATGATDYVFNPSIVFPTANQTEINLTYKSTGTITRTRTEETCTFVYECSDLPCAFDDIQCLSSQQQREIAEDQIIIPGECGYVRRCSTRTFTEEIEIEEDREKDYDITYTPNTPLSFTSVNRLPLDSVYCVNSGPVLLLGTPGNTFENKTYNLVSRGNDNSINQFLADYSFTPGYITAQDEIPPNDEGYFLIYKYLEAGSGCESVDTFNIYVVDVPDKPSLPDTSQPIYNGLPILMSYCLGAEIDSITLSDALPNFTEYVWRDDRGFVLDSGSSFTPPVNTNIDGLTRFSVELTNLLGGCTGETQEFWIQIGDQPSANYSFTSQCSNAAVFENKSSHPGQKLEGDSIQNIYFNYNDGEASEFMAVAGQTHQFSFSAPGVYDVQMAVQTSIGCTDTISKLVTVFDEADYELINDKYAFTENFSSGSNGWISTTDNNNAPATARNSSWNIRQVEGQTAWHAFNESTGTYNDNEFSWVQSPYFNLDNWNAPKLQMDILFDTPELEGAVVQYQIINCDNAEAERVWRTLGEQEGGLNWYNNGSISAGPGGSINGWSGLSTSQGSTTAEWETVAYNLGTVKAEAQGKLVQFRVAFASLALGGNREPSRKGFAFTNLSIVEKNRNSLIEHFTSLNLDVPDPERNRLANFANSREDVIYLQYHTIFPTPDSLHYGYHFRLNASNDHLTRSYSRYGFDKPIYTIMNGRFTNRDPFFASAWGEKQYSSESLLAAAFEMDVDYSYEEGKPLQVKVSATRTNIPVPLIDTAQGGILLTIKAAIVERVITNKNSDDTLYNVLVKLIPDHSGAALKSTWPAGETLELSEEWVVPIEATPGQFGIVTWIETAFRNEVNQYGKAMIEVFQAIEKPIDIALIPAQILSNRQTMQGNWVIYPVPAREHIKIQRQEEIYSPITWRIISTTGAMIKEGRYKGGSNAIDINIAGLNAGIYMLQMTSSEGQLQRKFVKE